MLVAVPSTAADAKGLLKSAIRDDNPVLFIEHEYLYGQRGEVPDDDDHTVDFGQAAIRREGEDERSLAEADRGPEGAYHEAVEAAGREDVDNEPEGTA